MTGVHRGCSGGRAPPRVVVVALILGRTERARIAGALRGLATVQFCDLAAELADAGAASGVRAVLTELHDRAGAPTASVLQALHAQRPDVVTLIYLSLTAADVHALVVLAVTAGVRGVVVHDIDDAGITLANALRTAQGTATTSALLAVVEPVVPRLLWPFFSFCVTGSVERLTVAEAAAALGVPRRTLVARLRRAGLPGPQRVIGWCRVLHAARLLEDSGDGLEHVAMALDFPSASALHNQLRRYDGRFGAAARARGGFMVLLEAFVRELRSR